MRDAAFWFVRLMSALVPAGARREFVEEWHAEIDCHCLQLESRSRIRDAAVLGLRTVGALPDAIALLRQDWSLDMLIQDLRYALRILAQRYGLTALVVLTLALGIGANTAVFSVVNGLLLQPLPYPDSSRLLMVWEDDRVNQKPRYSVAPGNYIDWLTQNRSFEALAAFSQGTADLTGHGEPVRIGASVVWPTMFDVLKVAAALGRTFREEDAKAGNNRVVVISHAAWQSRFAADPAIVGREIRLGGNPYQVVGVMPRGFAFPDREVEVWRPMVFQGDPSQARAVHFLSVIGRLAPGVSIQQAQHDLDAIAARAAQQYPGTNDQRGVTLVTLRDQLVGDVRTVLYVIAAAVGMVLLIGCANVANLLLAAATGRRREMAVRAALGAGRMRLVRQLLVEGLVLSALGGAAGVVFAIWSTRLLAASGSAWLPQADRVAVDSTVLVFAAGVSLLTGVLFALVPALHASRTDLQEALNEGGRGTGPSRAARRTGRFLVVAEIALAVALVVGAGLVLRSFWKLQQVPAGFTTDGVLTASVSLPGSRYDDGPKTQAFYGTLIERVRSLPGVRAVGAVNALPMSGPAATTWLTLEGRPRPQGEPPEVGLRVATPDYTRAMGIALVAGRMIDGTDTFTSMNVVVVNQALVDRFFPGQNPIGQRVRIGPNPNAPWRTIVGIVGNVHYDSLETEALPELYAPHSQIAWSGMTLAVRTDGDPMALVPGIRAALQSIDRDLPLSSVKPMADVLGESTARRRLTMLLIGAFAAIALTLAIVGVYGVLAWSVNQRRQEIGVRMALGARAGEVAGMFVRQGLALAAAGLAIGLTVALMAGRLIRSFLFGVEPTDVMTYFAVSGIILIVTAAACYVPARRAAGVDPVEALRR